MHIGGLNLNLKIIRLKEYAPQYFLQVGQLSGLRMTSCLHLTKVNINLVRRILTSSTPSHTAKITSSLP